MVGERRREVNGRLWIGVVFLALGALWTLDNLNVIEAEPILDWWPLILVAIGVSRLLGVGTRQRVVPGAVWTFIGLWLLAHNLGYLHIGVWQLWPVALIGIGGSMVWRSMRGPAQPGGTGSSAASITDDDTMSSIAIWAGVERKSKSQRFLGGDATAIMGGITIDLRDAKPAPGGATLEVFAMMGGIEIYVPRDWRVVNEAFVIMGGMEDSRGRSIEQSENVLIVKGAALMGGIEITDKKDKSD